MLGWQQHQLSYISEFTTDFRHVQGKNNPVADTLSRATIAEVHLGIDYNSMATAQQQDAEVQAYRTATSSYVSSSGLQDRGIMDQPHERAILVLQEHLNLIS